MKLETKDGWFKRGAGGGKKNQGGWEWVHNKNKPLLSLCPSGPTGASPSLRMHFLASVSTAQLSGAPRVAPWHGEQLVSYKSYVKKVNLNVSDAEAHSPLPHILAQLAFECKILPARPPEHSNSFTSAKTPWVKLFRHARP